MTWKRTEAGDKYPLGRLKDGRRYPGLVPMERIRSMFREIGMELDATTRAVHKIRFPLRASYEGWCPDDWCNACALERHAMCIGDTCMCDCFFTWPDPEDYLD